MNHSLLIELRTEELPPKSLKALFESFAASVFAAYFFVYLALPTLVSSRWSASPRAAPMPSRVTDCAS